jgi:hypothetical protein
MFASKCYAFLILCRKKVIRSKKVVGSIADEVIGFFNRSNPSSRNMALEMTQLLTEMSTRNLPGGKGQPAGA